MSTFKPWPERIKARMKELDMTQEELASKMSVTRSAITHYLAGRRVPPLRQFQRLAHALKVDPSWLQFGPTQKTDSPTKQSSSQEKESIPHLYPIPILNWSQTSEILDIKKIQTEKIKDWIPHIYTDQIDHYALRINGDAMTSPSGHSETFLKGMYIIIDPRKKAENNDYVIALLPRAKEVTFKKYVIDGGVRYLKPLNPQYPIVQVDDKTQICGVLAYHVA